jgi:hypothetical protein
MTSELPSETNSDALRLALLADLESSLRSTEQAILARDVAGLERATDEQANLHRRLVLLPVHGSPFSAAVMEAQRRVLQLGQVESALLERAQQRLRMLANWLAGPEAEYRAVSGKAAVLVQRYEVGSQK